MFDILGRPEYNQRTGAVLATHAPVLTTATVGADAMADESILPPEEWRPAPGFRAYEISSLGRVRRIAPGRGAVVGKILRPKSLPTGHLYVSLRENGETTDAYVHRLVCLAFNGKPANSGMEVAHWDGDPAHNWPSNLRWATRADNVADMVRHGRAAFGERSASAKLTETQVIELRASYIVGQRREVRRLADQYKISSQQVRKILARQRWAHLK